LRKITLGFHNVVMNPRDVMRRFKRNSSLEEINVSGTLQGEANQAKLRSFAERNRRIHQLLNSPETVPMDQ
jgi:hypothetical protein